MTNVWVQFLGTGSPFANGGRMQSCILLDCPDGRVLLDCGATALLAMDRYDIASGSIDAVMITHFHGDHLAGVPFLLMESRFNLPRDANRPERTKPLVIAGPVGIERQVRQLCALLRYSNGLTEMEARGLLRFVELVPEQPTAIGPATVTAYPVQHTPEALGLRVAIGGKTVGYSGDTVWTDSLPQIAANADLFICLAFSFEPMDSMLSHHDLRAHRTELTTKRLILTHIAAEMHVRRAEADEEVAEDGQIITL